jgi:hypothetical protein
MGATLIVLFNSNYLRLYSKVIFVRISAAFMGIFVTSILRIAAGPHNARQVRRLRKGSRTHRSRRTACAITQLRRASEAAKPSRVETLLVLDAGASCPVERGGTLPTDDWALTTRSGLRECLVARRRKNRSGTLRTSIAPQRREDPDRHGYRSSARIRREAPWLQVSPAGLPPYRRAVSVRLIGEARRPEAFEQAPRSSCRWERSSRQFRAAPLPAAHTSRMGTRIGRLNRPEKVRARCRMSVR